MEVHPPHRPISSFKEFMVHLLAITIGLLIALGLEATAEWFRHRHMVGEAEANIEQEMRDNQQRLEQELNLLPKETNQLEKLMGVVDARERGKSAQADKNLVWSVTRLGESSWNTAFSTGTIAHMEYDEVRRYSRLYALQQLFNTSMDRYLESRRDMYAFLAEMDLPGQPSQTEFENGKRVIASEMVTAQFLREIGTSLKGSYKEFQEGRQ